MINTIAMNTQNFSTLVPTLTLSYLKLHMLKPIYQISWNIYSFTTRSIYIDCHDRFIYIATDDIFSSNKCNFNGNITYEQYYSNGMVFCQRCLFNKINKLFIIIYILFVGCFLLTTRCVSRKYDENM